MAEMSEEWKFGDWYVDRVVDRATVAFCLESSGLGLCHGRDKTEARISGGARW